MMKHSSSNTPIVINIGKRAKIWLFIFEALLILCCVPMLTFYKTVSLYGRIGMLSFFSLTAFLMMIAFLFQKKITFDPLQGSVIIQRSFQRSIQFSFEEIQAVSVEDGDSLNQVVYWVFFKRKPLYGFPLSTSFPKQSKALSFFEQTVLSRLKEMIPTLHVGPFRANVYPENLSMYDRRDYCYTLLSPHRKIGQVLFAFFFIATTGILLGFLFKTISPTEHKEAFIVFIPTIALFIDTVGRKVVFDLSEKTVSNFIFGIAFKRRNFSEFNGISTVPFYVNGRYSSTAVILKFRQGTFGLTAYSHPVKGKILVAETLFLLTGET